MNFQRLARHLNALLWVYFGTAALSYLGLSYALLSTAGAQPIKTTNALPTFLMFTSSAVFLANALFWGFSFVKVFAETPRYLFPQEVEIPLASGRLRLKEMAPIQAIDTLRTLSRLEPFKELMFQALMPMIFLLLLPAVAVPLFTVFAGLSLTIAVSIFLLSFGVSVGIWILWMPSLSSTVISPTQRLLSALSIAQFLPVFEKIKREHEGKMSYFIVRSLLTADERFLIQKVLSYSNQFLREVAPAAVSGLSSYWTTLYAALRFGEEPELNRALGLLERFRTILRTNQSQNEILSQILASIISIESELPKSWAIVKAGNIRIEREKRFPWQKIMLTGLDIALRIMRL